MDLSHTLKKKKKKKEEREVISTGFCLLTFSFSLVNHEYIYTKCQGETNLVNQIHVQA